MTSLTFTVNGTPGAQGSKRHVGRGIMVESSKKVKPWRSDVKAAAEQAIRALEDAFHGDVWTPLDGPLHVQLTFRFRRPQGHYGTGRNAGTLKQSAPEWPTSRALGDGDKLQRSTFDALTAAGVIVDDSLLVDIRCRKVWCENGETPGATIVVGTLHRERRDWFVDNYEVGAS